MSLKENAKANKRYEIRALVAPKPDDTKKQVVIKNAGKYDMAVVVTGMRQ